MYSPRLLEDSATEIWYVVCEHRFARSVTAAQIMNDFFEMYHLNIKAKSAGVFSYCGPDIGSFSRFATSMFNLTGISAYHKLTKEKADSATKILVMTRDIRNYVINDLHQPNERVISLDLPHAGLSLVIPGTTFLKGILEERIVPHLIPLIERASPERLSELQKRWKSG